MVGAPAKKDIDEKVTRNPSAGSKKSDNATSRTGAVAGAATATKPVNQPLKIEPKIIETPQPEFIQRNMDQTLFTPDELDMFRGAPRQRTPEDPAQGPQGDGRRQYPDR